MVLLNTAAQVKDLVDDVLWGNLYRFEEMPFLLRLQSSLSDSGTSVAWDTSYITAEQEGTLRTGLVVEVDSELMLVTDINVGTKTLTVRRGWFGTVATTHDSTSMVVVSPTYPRHRVEQAVANAIVGLSPPLFAVKHLFNVAVDSSPLDAPDDLYYPVGFVHESSGLISYGAVQLLDPYGPSNTDKALLFPGVASGATGHLKYLGSFDFPTADTDYLDDLGLRPEHHRLVVIDATMAFMHDQDQDDTVTDVIHDWMAEQGRPPATGAALRRSLIQEYQYLLQRALHRQQALTGAIVTTKNGIVLP